MPKNKIKLFYVIIIYWLVANHHLYSIDVNRVIDSIKQINENIHDTVKIKNYIFLTDQIGTEYPDTSIYYINKALTIDSAYSHKFTAKLLLYKARFLNDKLNYSSALKLYNKALELTSNDNKFLYAEINNSLATLYIDLNMYDEALISLTNALSSINEKQFPILYSKILNSYGFLYSLQKNYIKALEYYKKSFKIFKQQNDSGGISLIYNNIGTVYLNLGILDSLLYYFQKSLNIDVKMHNEKVQAFPLYNIAETYFKMAQYQNSLKYAIKALQIDKKFNNIEGLATDYDLLGKLNSKIGNYNLSDYYFKKAINICLKSNFKRELKEAYFNLSEHYTLLKNYKQALYYFKLYNQLNDSLLNIDVLSKINEIENRFYNETQIKKNEFQKLKIENQQNIIQKQKTRIITFTSSIIILIVFLLIIYRNYRLKIKSNKILIRQKKQIKTLSEQIHHTDKLKINFFTNISHELRTPLSVIHGITEEILESNTLRKAKINACIIKNNTFKLTNMVNQLLDIRKLDDGEMKINLQKGNISSFVLQTVQMLESLAKQKNVILEFIKQSTEITGYFDADKLEKIVLNLLSNALKFSKPYGKVSTSLRPTTDNMFFKIQIQDEGIGIPENQLNSIFMPFFQASNNTNGSGIGLSLTKDLIELQKGSISVESTLNKGSSFKVTLPLSIKIFNTIPGCYIINTEDVLSNNKINFYSVYNTNIQAVSEPEESEYETENDNKTTSVLIVEDNNDLRNYMRNKFKPKYKVYTANNGIDGLKKARSVLPDIIISDIMMPEMDGNTMCNILKNDENTSHIPLILLTAKCGEEHKLKGLEYGADDYIFKPFNSQELLLKAANITKRYEKFKALLLNGHEKINPENLNIAKIDKTIIKRIIEIIEQNIQNPDFGSSMLAEKMEMSRTLIFKKLKALTGMPASRFIASVRLKKAARIFRENPKNISEVAYEVGFNDPEYFSRLFKKTFQMTPSQFISSKTNHENL